MEWLSVNQLEGRTHKRKSQQQAKTKHNQKANINGIPFQDQPAQEIKDTALLNLTGLLPQKFTPETQGVSTDRFKKQRLIRSLTNNGKKKKTSQIKRKEEASERMPNEIEATQLSDIEFKAMAIRKLSEFTEH